MESRMELSGSLSAVIHRANGNVEDLGVISGPRTLQHSALDLKPLGFWKRMWRTMKRDGKIPAAMGLTTFVVYMTNLYLTGHSDPYLMGIVTTAGVNYMATDFASGGVSPRISAFNFHASGTGQLQGSTNNLASPFASNATPIVITETAHGRTTNDLVAIAGVTTNTAANGNWQILNLTANTYSLYGSAGNGVAGGTPTAQRINGCADTALTTDSGVARVTGVQTNPSPNIYKSVATMAYVSSLNISEFGLFSASSAGTLLDRRVFNSAGSPATTASAALTLTSISVNSGDSIQFSYSLNLTQGGS